MPNPFDILPPHIFNLFTTQGFATLQRHYMAILIRIYSLAEFNRFGLARETVLAEIVDYIKEANAESEVEADMANQTDAEADSASLAGTKPEQSYAAYIIRRGSRDLGSRTLEGSRPGMAMLVHAGLSIIGRKGYELLIDQGIERARRFARRIDAHPDFELVTEPELNILTYRYMPAWVQQELAQAPADKAARINELLDMIIEAMQKRQREAGRTFVSRTSLAPGPASRTSCAIASRAQPMPSAPRPPAPPDARRRPGRRPRQGQPGRHAPGPTIRP